MNKYLISFLTIAALIIAGCGKTPVEEPKPGPEPVEEEFFKVTADKSVTMPAEGGSFVIKLSSSSSWDISVLNTRADWVMFSPLSGPKGDYEIKVTVAANTEYDSREATVRLKSANNDTFDIVVSQKHAEALTVTASRNDFPAEGGTLTITVSANIDFTYQVGGDCADWISEASTKGLSTTTLNFAIAENKRTSARSGAITISSSKGTETIRVNQAALVPSIVVSKTQVPVGYAGGEFSVDVTSNMDAKVTVNVPWIHETSTKATSTNTFSFSVDPNPEYDPRKGTITFSVEGLTQEVVVEQQTETALVITMSEYVADCAGEYFGVVVSSNQAVSTSVSVPWLSVATTKGLTDTEMIVGVEANTSLSERTGTITFTSQDGSKSQVLTVKQNGEAPKLWASKESLSFYVNGGEESALILGNVDFKTEIIGNEDGWFRISISDAADSRAPFCKRVSVSADYNSNNLYRKCQIKYSNEATGLSGIIEIDQEFPSGVIAVSSSTVIPKEGGDLFVVLTACEGALKNIKLPSWISQVQTKSVSVDTLYLRAEPTPFKYQRSSMLELESTLGSGARFEVVQEGDDSKPGVPDDEIWYTMYGDNIINFNHLPTLPFDQSIVSVTYEDGMGKIKFAGPVKNVFSRAFEGFGHIIFDPDYNQKTIRNVYLPDCVESIGYRAFCGTELTSFYLPANLKSIGREAFYNSPLTRFTGKHASTDGKSIIIGSTYYLLAPAVDDASYTVQPGVKDIAESAFSWHRNLKSVVFPDGLVSIGQDAFSHCALEYVTIPASVEMIGYAAFSGNNIRKFLGDSKFISADGLYLYEDYPLGDGKIILLFANGSGVENYTVPEGVNCLDSYSFENNKDLKYITLPSSFMKVNGEAFLGATSLRGVFGSHVSADNRAIIVNGDLQFVVPFGIKNFYVDGTVKSISGNAITHCEDLETIVINDNVTKIGMYAFTANPKLTSITLPASLVSLGYDPFISSPELTDVWVRSVDPPTIDEVMVNMQSGKVRYHVPSASLARYKSNMYWRALADRIVGYNYTDLPGSTSAYYSSTDYSADGKVKTIQKATKGNGIDIVIMGDGYTDMMIADGTYDSALQRIADALFDEEPFRSYRDCFNVYQVDVVSKNGLIGDDALTALNTRFVVGTEVGGSDNVVQDYAKLAVKNLDEALIIVLINENKMLGGTCYMYDGDHSDYGSGLSICYFSNCPDYSLFSGIVNHEAVGHGFGKLADEYAYESYGAYVPGSDASLIYHELMGWYRNVDVNGDPTQIKWAKFLSDSRYANEGVGIFEGAYTYWKGVYRPSDYSLMRFNQGGFNAPSREAIWRRIQHLSNGASWTYDYEDFVKYDAVNLDKSAPSSVHKNGGHFLMNPAQHCPPVLKGKRE